VFPVVAKRLVSDFMAQFYSLLSLLFKLLSLFTFLLVMFDHLFHSINK
jgi:hypothetical protein